MIVSVVLLIAGLLLIIKGGDLFVSSSVRIAEFLRMPRVVIGSTLVSLATTTPEMVVSIMSGLRGESGLAVGNAVGSCICNIGLILGVAATMKQVDVHLSTLRTPLAALFVFGGMLFGMSMDLELARWQGGVLMFLGLAYFSYDFFQHQRASRPGQAAEAGELETQMVAAHSFLQTRGGTALQFLAGAAVVVVGSRLLVDSAVDIAKAVGVPSIIIGLTVVAVGTSLPELVTAVTSSKRNVSDLAVGNVLGANIANVSLVVGAAALFQPVTMSRAAQLYNFPALLLLLLLLVGMLASHSRITRREGAGLLAFYGAYIVGLVVLTVLGYT